MLNEELLEGVRDWLEAHRPIHLSDPDSARYELREREKAIEKAASKVTLALESIIDQRVEEKLKAKK